MLELPARIFKGYGKFIIFIALAIIVPELTHQHFNYSSFSEPVRLLFRYGILFFGLGVLIKDVVGGELEL